MPVMIEGILYPSHKEYFERHPGKQYANKRVNAQLLLEAHNKRCPDCGLYWHPAVMTLDHVNRDGYRSSDGRRKAPAKMTGYPTELFKDELRKTEAVCSNCHKIREMERDGHLRRKKWQPFNSLPRKGALINLDEPNNDVLNS